jgi:hypothetical protein
MVPIFPIFAVFWTFFWINFYKIFTFVPKKVYTLVFGFYCFFELSEHVKHQLNVCTGDREIYTLMHGRSNVLLDYSDYIAEHPEDDWKGFDRIESLHVARKYETPVTAWAHVPDEEKITALYSTF